METDFSEIFSFRREIKLYFLMLGKVKFRKDLKYLHSKTTKWQGILECHKMYKSESEFQSILRQQLSFCLKKMNKE